MSVFFDWEGEDGKGEESGVGVWDVGGGEGVVVVEDQGEAKRGDTGNEFGVNASIVMHRVHIRSDCDSDIPADTKSDLVRSKITPTCKSPSNSNHRPRKQELGVRSCNSIENSSGQTEEQLQQCRVVWRAQSSDYYERLSVSPSEVAT